MFSSRSIQSNLTFKDKVFSVDYIWAKSDIIAWKQFKIPTIKLLQNSKKIII